MSKKREDIIILIAVMIVLTGVVAFLVYTDYNSPSKRVERDVKAYLAQHYPDSDYEISSISFDDKYKNYIVSISSPSIADSWFTMTYDDDGTFMANSYEDQVVKKTNTAIRLSNEYNAAVDAVLETTSPWNDFRCVGRLMWRTSDRNNGEPYYIISDELELDASYDLTELGAKAGSLSLHVDVDSAKEVSMENLADILLYVRQTLDEADLPFYMVDCILDYHNGTKSKRLEVEEYLYEDIYEEDFEARLEKVVKQS